MGQAFDVLMKRLGYSRYVAQGGDWGSAIVQAMGRQAPSGLLGIHTNLPSTVPGDVGTALAAGGPAPAGLSEQEHSVFDSLKKYGREGNSAYLTMMSARPQAVGYGMTDSPAGLAAFILVHPGFCELEVWRRSATDTHEGRGAGRFHSLLADKQRGLVGLGCIGRNHGRGITSAVAQQTEKYFRPRGGHCIFPRRSIELPSRGRDVLIQR
jgi:hypothetical protein